ncbi:NADP-dependent oxidoreductase [Micromonospora sp. Llam7]|uniref:NADP-dependent oxidoreductase n=1 Tax=Micromonospora tarapacensis TaxID=2835305 RepID=UPI001C82AE5C|nr:NADP-dependent oxidoreductase [Micromonospora tarapacensis]MBX7269584.1 NADP-dependent oxidoreductase [Micromonospora tarapacensis]
MAIAIVFAEYGDPEVLHPIDIDPPTPAAGQVRVRVKAAGVNPVDAKLRRGDFAAVMPADFPSRIGNEYAGIIDQIGDEVTGFAAGDQVLGSATGQCYAEYVVADASDVVRKPATMPWTVAAGLPAVGQTAHTALRQIAVRAGDTVLIHAAAGGVGTIAIQLAHLSGATVIGTASERNHDYLRSLGATPVVYGEGLIERVHALAPAGVDAALDAIGGEGITASLALVPDRHRIGTLVDAEAPKTYGIQRVGGRSTAALRELVTLYEHGSLQLPIHATFPLTEAHHAHREVQTGHVRGKVVLTMP